MAILWSFLPICAAFLLGELVRLLLKKWLTRKSFVCRYAGELISTFEFSAAVFEIAVIGKHYSTALGFICSFCFLCLKNTAYILDGLSANPCGLLEGIVKKKSRKSWIIDFVTTVCSQLTGALLAFPFMQFVWKSTASELHFKHLNKGLSSSLEVSLLFGFLVEVVTTFVLTMIDLLTRGGLRVFNPYIRAIACVVICYALTGTTGVWMNPVFATVHSFLFTKAKEDIIEHMFVFWVGPIIGTLIALSVDARLRVPERKPKPIAKSIRKKLCKQLSNGTMNGSHSMNRQNGTVSRSNESKHQQNGNLSKKTK